MNKNSSTQSPSSERNETSSDISERPDNQKDRHLVSIIVPVYNVQEFLRSCLESLANQTYKNIEVVLVNDGSTDNSLDICNEFSAKDSRFVVINQSNQGMSIARNTGLKSSSGNFILYVDSDDFISEDTLGILISRLLEEKSDICIFEKIYWFYGENQAKEFKLTENYQNCLLDEVLLIDDIHLYSPCTKLYKRSFLENIYFPEELLHEDVFYWIAILSKRPKISIGPGSIYYYRKNNKHSITRIGNNMKERKIHLAKSFKMGVDFALENNVSDNFIICLLSSFFLFFPYPDHFSIENEKYIVNKLISKIPNYKRLLHTKSSLIYEYQYLFKSVYFDKHLLRINLLPKYRKYVLDFSLRLIGSFTFRLIIGRAI